MLKHYKKRRGGGGIVAPLAPLQKLPKLCLLFSGEEIQMANPTLLINIKFCHLATGAICISNDTSSKLAKSHQNNEQKQLTLRQMG